MFSIGKPKERVVGNYAHIEAIVNIYQGLLGTKGMTLVTRDIADFYHTGSSNGVIFDPIGGCKTIRDDSVLMTRLEFSSRIFSNPRVLDQQGEHIEKKLRRSGITNLTGGVRGRIVFEVSPNETKIDRIQECLQALDRAGLALNSEPLAEDVGDMITEKNVSLDKPLSEHIKNTGVKWNDSDLLHAPQTEVLGYNRQVYLSDESVKTKYDCVVVCRSGEEPQLGLNRIFAYMGDKEEYKVSCENTTSLCFDVVDEYGVERLLTMETIMRGAIEGLKSHPKPDEEPVSVLEEPQKSGNDKDD